MQRRQPNSSQRGIAIGQEAMDTNCKNRNSSQVLGNIPFAMRMVKYWNSYWRGSDISISGDTQNSAGQGREQQAIIGSALSEELDKSTSRDAFPTQITLWLNSSMVFQDMLNIDQESKHPLMLSFTV